MEPRAVNVPLPCYGFELDVRDPQCCRCPHLFGCQFIYSYRHRRVPMERVRFNLVPENLQRKSPVRQEDPEYVYINDLYAQCHLLVFDRKFKPSESLANHADEIAKNADELGCSIRLYMLACMLGFQRHREDVHGAVQAGAVEFGVRQLLGKTPKNRVLNYVEICRKQFGTFTLEAIDLVARPDNDTTELDQGMRHSEMMAARFLIHHKLNSKLKPEAYLYERHERDFDSRWLAIEKSYYDTVLAPYLARPKRTESKVLQRKRYAVCQQMGVLKRKPNLARALHLSRTSIMRDTLVHVLHDYRLGPGDIECGEHDVTDAFKFWKELGRAVAQLKCLQMYYGPDLSKTYF